MAGVSKGLMLFITPTFYSPSDPLRKISDWEPDGSCVTEDDYTEDLAEFLREETEWDIEVCPNTPEGKPDILIGDLLALELKLNPSKNEINRLIGQCAHYSRQWMTWMVIIGAGSNTLGR